MMRFACSIGSARIGSTVVAGADADGFVGLRIPAAYLRSVQDGIQTGVPTSLRPSGSGVASHRGDALSHILPALRSKDRQGPCHILLSAKSPGTPRNDRGSCPLCACGTGWVTPRSVVPHAPRPKCGGETQRDYSYDLGMERGRAVGLPANG